MRRQVVSVNLERRKEKACWLYTLAFLFLLALHATLSATVTRAGSHSLIAKRYMRPQGGMQVDGNEEGARLVIHGIVGAPILKEGGM